MHAYKLPRSQDYPTSGGLLQTQSARRMEEASVVYQFLRRSGNSELRILRKRMIVNAPMAMEWYLTKMLFDEDRTRCMIRIYASYPEAAVLEDMIGTESGRLHGTTVGGGSTVGSTHATIMVAEEGGDDRSFNEIRVVCVMTYERRCVHMYAVGAVLYPGYCRRLVIVPCRRVLPVDTIGAR